MLKVILFPGRIKRLKRKIEEAKQDLDSIAKLSDTRNVRKYERLIHRVWKLESKLQKIT